MRSFWQSDTALKIFSIICAIALWFYVIAAQNPEIEVKVKNIPIQVDAASEEALYRATGLSVIKPTDGLKTSLTVKGRRSVIGGVDNKNIKAAVDVSEIEEAGLSAPLTVNVQLPESTSLYVMNINPLQVTYSVEPRKYRTISVEAGSSGSLPDDLVLHELVPTPKEIEVWGPESVINQIDHIAATVNLSNQTKDFSVNSAFSVVDAEGKVIDPINVSSHAESVLVEGVVHHEKTLPLSVDVSEAPVSSGLVVSSVSIEPKRLTVHGEKEDVSELETLPVSVNFDEFADEAGEQTIEAELQLPQGVYCDEKPTQISVKIVLKETEEAE